MKALGTPVAALLLAAAATAAPLGRTPAPPSRPASPRPAAGAMMPAGGSALQAALPDTTLARIFYAKGHTDIGVSQVRQAAYRLGARPDALTPDEVRQVLGLLVQQSVVGRRARQDGRHWSAADSAEYRLLEDRLTLSTALDSALAQLGFAIASRGDSVPDREALGIMLRDSAMARLHPVYDEDMLRTLAAHFEAMPKPAMDLPLMKRIEQTVALPAVSREDSARALVTSSAGSVTAGQLLTDLGRIPPTRRPQVQGVAQIRDLCAGNLYQNLLRRAVVEQDLAHKPRIVAQLAERADDIDVRRFVATQVYDRIPTDSTTLRRQFKAAPAGRYRAHAYASVMQVVVDTRAQADSVARELTVPGRAETLETKSRAAGISYRTLVDERSDSTLFARLRRGGVGAIVGPDAVPDGYRVLRVMELVPARAQTFEEAYPDVREQWFNAESQRRVQELMRQLFASTIVNTNSLSPYLSGKRRIPR